jgi:probable blue pigment (indigoidine) exporter
LTTPESPATVAAHPPPSPRLTALDVGLLAALALLWGVAYIFIREGIVFGASPLLFASVRYLFSAAGFAALAAVRRESFPTRSALLVSAGVGGVFVIGLYGGFLYWGEQYTTGGYAAVLAATAPILTVVIAYSILPSERLSPLALVGLAIGFAGTIILVVPALLGGPIGTWPGPLFLVGAYVSAAIGTVWLRRIGGGRQGLWQIGTQFAVAGLMLGAAGWILPIPKSFPLTAGVWYSLAGLVVFSSVMGYFVYFSLHHRIGPVRANIVAYLVPLVGVGIGSGLLGEPLTVWELLGFLVVIVGLTLILRESSRRAAAAAPPAVPAADAQH